MENLYMKNKKALALALASVTMAGAAVTAYSTITAPSVHADEFVRKTEWITISNDRSRTRTTVYFESGDQKIAQFKKDSQSWTDLLGDIKFHAEISADKEAADKENYQRYEELARKIATLRNQRIESSKAQIKGFNSDSVNVEAVYHVLMPTPKGENPKIFVGETSYLPVDIDNLVIEGSTTKNNPTNFRFTDGQHHYKYTAADSQLHMTFNNKDIVVDTWDVHYIEDPFFSLKIFIY